MIEKYFDEPIIQIGSYEYSLDEIDDFEEWFRDEKPDTEDMNDRELTIYRFWMENQ